MGLWSSSLLSARQWKPDLLNLTVWVKGLTAGVTTRWLAHTPIQALFSLEMLMIYGSLNKSLKWKTFNGTSMQVNDSSNGQCAELHVGSHGQNHKFCICCMLQWDTYSESGNPFIIWLLWIPCSLQHVMFDCSSLFRARISNLAVWTFKSSVF